MYFFPEKFPADYKPNVIRKGNPMWEIVSITALKTEILEDCVATNRLVATQFRFTWTYVFMKHRCFYFLFIS